MDGDGAISRAVVAVAGVHEEEREEGGSPVRLYHGTTPAAIAVILRGGFRDGTGYYLTDSLHTGVWLSDRPLEGNLGPETFLEVNLDVPEEQMSNWEWVEEGKGYREWLVPADIINRHATIRQVQGGEFEAIVF